ncbi:hypothetical protein [Streptomyces sp. NPDC017941]|uniref:hypothetical protein n=1 Tax=Streptomyces sp. NPDC017941 TaxID=3365018 RepID=UPI0037A4D17E
MGLTLMGTKKRAAVAACVAGTVGAAASATASLCGVEPAASAQIGIGSAAAVGNLLFQVLHLASADASSYGSAAGSPPPGSVSNSAAAPADTVRATAEAANPAPVARRSTRRGTHAPYPKHPRHRRRERAARRRVERRGRPDRGAGDQGRGAL